MFIFVYVWKGLSPYHALAGQLPSFGLLEIGGDLVRLCFYKPKSPHPPIYMYTLSQSIQFTMPRIIHCFHDITSLDFFFHTLVLPVCGAAPCARFRCTVPWPANSRGPPPNPLLLLSSTRPPLVSEPVSLTLTPPTFPTPIALMSSTQPPRNGGARPRPLAMLPLPTRLRQNATRPTLASALP
jgi:hypothetical protein